MEWFALSVDTTEGDHYIVAVKAKDITGATQYLYENFLSCNDKIHEFHNKIQIKPSHIKAWDGTDRVIEFTPL